MGWAPFDWDAWMAAREKERQEKTEKKGKDTEKETEKKEEKLKGCAWNPNLKIVSLLQMPLEVTLPSM